MLLFKYEPGGPTVVPPYSHSNQYFTVAARLLPVTLKKLVFPAFSYTTHYGCNITQSAPCYSPSNELHRIPPHL